MRPRAKTPVSQGDLFRSRLDSIIDLRHELVKLAGVINWAVLEERFGQVWSDKGRPAIPTRTMVGMAYLQAIHGLSDELAVARWVENPYWQYFCGETWFQHKPPIDRSSMSRWRKRIQEQGLETLLQETIQAGLKAEAVKESSLERVTVDSTVQPKAITHPTDAKLYKRGLDILVRMAAKEGIPLRQSYAILSRQALIQCGRLFRHPAKIRQAKAAVKRLKVYLGRVHRELGRKLAERDVASPRWERVMGLMGRLLAQKKSDQGKVYSLHEPQVVCISKGKAHKKYEFGSKVSVAVTNRESFVVGIRTLPGNPFDGHTLKGALEQVNRLTGVAPQRCYTDKGYPGHGVTGGTTRVIMTGRQRGMTPTMHRELRRRSAIEATIGHMKNEGRLDRNWLRGSLGDQLNALMAGIGYNLRVILKKLRLLFAQILAIILEPAESIFCWRTLMAAA